MAKKQKRSSKNRAPGELERIQRESETKRPASQPLTQVQFATLIAAVVGLVFYVALFLFTKTEFGDRFGTYLVLLFNLDIYRAFWTGSPDGSFHLVDRWPILAGMIFHLALAFGLGSFVLSRLSWNSHSRIEHFVCGAGLGLAVLSTYSVTVGLLQILAFKQLLLLPILIVSVLGWIELAKKKKTILASFANADDGDGWSQWIWTACIPFLVLVILASMIPPWEFDVREYHLQVPKEWFQQGGVGFLSHNVYGNMPLGTEMHALVAMLYCFGNDDWWWGVLIGKSLSGFFVVLNAMAIYCIGRRIAGDFAGMAGGIIYISTPWGIANGIIGYNESAVSFYLLLSLLVVLECWRRSKDGQLEAENVIAPFPHSISLLVGLLIGAAIACKYTAIPFVAFPLVLVFAGWMLRAFGSRCTLSHVAWLLVGVGAIAGIWFIKNLFLTGNPTYPLLESVFDTSRTPLQVQQWARAHSPDTPIPSLSVLQSILHTLVLSFKWLSPLTVPFAVMAFLSQQKRVAWWLAGYLVFVFVVWLCLTHRLERFLLPFYSIACVLAGLGAGWLPKRNWKVIACVALILGCGLNFLFASSRLVGDVRIFASMTELDLRRLDARDYRHPEDQIIPLNHLSPTIAWLNKKHPDARVLLFGECRPLTAEFQVIYNTCFDPCETWKRFSGLSEDKSHELLHSEGITHVLINVSELNRFQSTYGYNVEDGGKPVTPRDLVQLEGKVFRRIVPSEVLAERDPFIILLEVLPK